MHGSRTGRLLSTAALLAGFLLLAACGEKDETVSEEDEVRAVFEDWRTAFAEGDGETACELWTDQQGQLYVRGANTRTKQPVKTCEQAFQVYARSPIIRDIYRQKAEEEITGVSAEGDRASVTTSAPVAGEAELVRVGDQWKVASGG